MKSTARSTASETTKKSTGLDASTWTYRFIHEGRTFTLVKRKPGRESPWYLDTIIAGRRIFRGLASNDARIAAERAVNNFIAPAKGGRWEAVETNKGRSTFATVGALLECYSDIARGHVSPHTIHHNLGSMRAVLRRAVLKNDAATPAQVDELSTSCLTGKCVGDFEEWMVKAGAEAGRNPESTKRTVKGYLRQARSVFNREIVQRYPEKGISLPALNDFLTRRTARPARISKTAPPDGLMDSTCAAAAKLKETDPTTYMVWLLGFYSLRRGEIDRMRFDWIMRIEGQWIVRIPAESKSKTIRDIPIDPLVVDALTEYQRTRIGTPDADLVLPTPPQRPFQAIRRLRCDGAFKKVNAFMRAQGWTGRQTLHALRAEYLRRIRRAYGLDAAQAIGGHADSRTTEQSYTGTPQAEKGAFIPFPSAKAAGQ